MSLKVKYHSLQSPILRKNNKNEKNIYVIKFNYLQLKRIIFNFLYSVLYQN